MRLIDADALHEALKTKQKWVVRCGDKHNEGYTYDQVHFAIDDAPTIDAVSVVRCKECKHWNDNDVFCRYFVKGHTDADDYCSYGERSDT